MDCSIYFSTRTDHTQMPGARAQESGKKKTNKHKQFRRDGLRDKQELSLGQMGPFPGTKWDPSLGQTGLSLFNSTVKSLFCPVCPWDGWGFVPGTIVPQGPSEKCLCVFCLLVFFAPNCIQFQRRRDDNKNKICTFEGGWAWGGEENCHKMLFFSSETPRQ